MPQQMPGLMIDLSPDDTHVSQHPPGPINLHGVDISSLDARDIQVGGLASLTPLPTSPDERERDGSRSFFAHRGASPSAGRIRDEAASMDGSVGDRSASVSPWRKPRRNLSASSPAENNSPDGSRSGDVPHQFYFNSQDNNDFNATPITTPTPTSSIATATPPPRPVTGDTSAQADAKKANKKRLQVLPGRSKSLRAEDEMKKASKKTTVKKASVPQPLPGTTSNLSTAPPPPEKDRSFRDMMKSSLRDKSEDRLAESQKRDKRDGKEKQSREIRDKQPQPKPAHPLSSALRQHNTSTFFNEFRNTQSHLGRASKGLFSKFSRSGSSNEKAPVKVENHIPSVLNLPLVQQTRITRIAKSYDHCKDKTEFWMPALPWRCIDYLNGKCEEEGLYRVSGGLVQVREWRTRFDTELDVNLLDESELYDASIIASLFKEWIRELPEDIFPKDAQQRVTSQLPDKLPERGIVSQLLRDELQHLPPFHYYLLFAITCHLSLLLSYEAKNKMTLDNLYRCFNQSLKLDGRIFYTLVGDWRQCWAGCVTENEYLRAEYDYLQHPYPQFIRDSDDYVAAQADERAISSSGSSAPPATGIFTPELQRPATSHTQPSNSAEEGDFWLSPVRKAQRSSSDVTGMSPLRSTFDTAPHES